MINYLKYYTGISHPVLNAVSNLQYEKKIEDRIACYIFKYDSDYKYKKTQPGPS